MDTSDAYRYIREDRKTNRHHRLETWVNAYISLRRALGFKTANLESLLRRLLNFMHTKGLKSFGQIDRNSGSEWLHSGSPQEITVACRLGTMRGFFRYLLSFGVVGENIWQTYQTPTPKHFIPYIFTVEELTRLFNHMHSQVGLGRQRDSHVRCAYFTMFHTIYACGLRSQEACRLKIGDVNFERSFFVISDTKFHKTRIVPFNTRTRDLILKYLNQFRPADDELHPGAPLFLNSQIHPFQTKALGKYLNHACKAVHIHQLKRPKGNTVFGGTTLHSLRHSFAVHRLLKWYKEGADVNAKLPLLATYMGHSHYRYTQCYLTVLPVFINIAGKMFADKFETPLKDMECPDNL